MEKHKVSKEEADETFVPSAELFESNAFFGLILLF